jgi:hypothetical protein
MSVYAVSSEIYRFSKLFKQQRLKIHHVECFLYGIMLTIKCFQFLVLRNKVEKLKNSKKGEKHFLQVLCDQTSVVILPI